MKRQGSLSQITARDEDIASCAKNRPFIIDHKSAAECLCLRLGQGDVSRGSWKKERRPPLRHQGIRSGGNLRVFENLAQTLVAVDAP